MATLERNAMAYWQLNAADDRAIFDALDCQQIDRMASKSSNKRYMLSIIKHKCQNNMKSAEKKCGKLFTIKCVIYLFRGELNKTKNWKLLLHLIDRKILKININWQIDRAPNQVIWPNNFQFRQSQHIFLSSLTVVCENRKSTSKNCNKFIDINDTYVGQPMHMFNVCPIS